MQKRVWLIIIVTLIVAVLLSACQSPTQLPVTETDDVSSPTEPIELPEEQDETEIPAIQAEAYPGPDVPYPPPVLVVPVYNPYPGPSEGENNYLSWTEAEALVLRGEVSEAYQAHTLHVTLVLINGDVVLTVEPEIDEIYKVIESCGDLCTEIILATE